MARTCNRRSVLSVQRAHSRDPLDRINSVGGLNTDSTRWKLSQAQVIALIEERTDEFYVRTGGQVVKLVVFKRGGEKYLQSEREKTHPDDLLKMKIDMVVAT